jgi:2-succinyl-6-hydroxy-2,4-cyclohexadiene-1-carboxylate synthase
MTPLAREAEALDIDACGVRLRVLREGAGPPVVALHGFTGAAESLAGVAERLCGRHTVLRVDLVGHGESEAPRALAPYAMKACAAQLDAVCAALGFSAAHWLGYSMGGRAALAVAAFHPARVRSLLLVGASAGIADAAERAARVRDDEALADAIERDGVPAFVERWMALPLFASQARLGATALAQQRALRLRNRAHGLANSLRGMGAGAQPPLHDALARLAAPACFVAGTEDAKFRALAERLAAIAPRAEARLVANAGHAAHLEAPDAFAALALAFFARAQNP